MRSFRVHATTELKHMAFGIRARELYRDFEFEWEAKQFAKDLVESKGYTTACVNVVEDGVVRSLWQ